MNALERQAFERTVRFSNTGAINPVSLKPTRKRSTRKPLRFYFRWWVILGLFFIGYLLGLFLPKFI